MLILGLIADVNRGATRHFGAERGAARVLSTRKLQI